MESKKMLDANAQVASDIVQNYNQDDTERLVGITAALDKKDEIIETLQAEKAALKNDKEFLVEQLQKAQAMVREDGEALMEAQSENASIKAQVRGMVEALEEITAKYEQYQLENTIYSTGYDAGLAVQAGIAEQALSTLPAEWLERERKREAVIQAARAMIERVGEVYVLDDHICDLTGEVDAALEALEDKQ